MKREYVVPDLLAAMTADALFAPQPQLRAGEPARAQRAACSLGRWFAAEPASPGASPHGRAKLPLDKDWVGGWYSRARLLQAATPVDAAAGAKPLAAAADGAKPGAAVTHAEEPS